MLSCRVTAVKSNQCPSLYAESVVWREKVTHTAWQNRPDKAYQLFFVVREVNNYLYAIDYQLLHSSCLVATPCIVLQEREKRDYSQFQKEVTKNRTFLVLKILGDCAQGVSFCRFATTVQSGELFLVRKWWQVGKKHYLPSSEHMTTLMSLFKLLCIVSWTRHAHILTTQFNSDKASGPRSCMVSKPQNSPRVEPL